MFRAEVACPAIQEQQGPRQERHKAGPEDRVVLLDAAEFEAKRRHGHGTERKQVAPVPGRARANPLCAGGFVVLAQHAHEIREDVGHALPHAQQAAEHRAPRTDKEHIGGRGPEGIAQVRAQRHDQPRAAAFNRDRAPDDDHAKAEERRGGIARGEVDA